MKEGIEFSPMGTVTVTLDGKDYVLKRPKLRQYRHYRDQIRELSTQAVETLSELREKLEKAKGKEAEAIEEEVAHVAANSFELTSIPWLKSAFEELGDPLPDDHEDWPAWLAADTSIPTRIITHWRTVPLAPGAKGTN